MKIQLEFAELIAPLFLGGKNHGLKLNTATLSGLKLEYDQKQKELLVYYGGKMAIIPSSSNVNSMTPATEQVQPQVAPDTAMAPFPEGKIKAQVSGPTAHVFEGPGAGQTGRG